MEPLFKGQMKFTCLSSIAPQVWGKFYVSMGVGYISADECTTNTEQVLRVYQALVHCSPRMSRILLACTFIRRVPRTILNVRGARRTK